MYTTFREIAVLTDTVYRAISGYDEDRTTDFLNTLIL